MLSMTEIVRKVQRRFKTEYSSRRLPMPEMIPDSVGTCLVYELRNDPDYIWKLKAVRRPWPNNRKIYHFRVYDENEADKQHIRVEDYLSLDAHPDLILWQGVCDSTFFKVCIKGVHEPPASKGATESSLESQQQTPAAAGTVQ